MNSPRPMKARPVILVLLGAFWPGHDAAGPNLSFQLLTESLADHFDFRLIARDRPFGAAAATVETGRWHDRGSFLAYHLPVGRTGAIGLGRLLRETPHTMRMINSFFDKEFSIPTLLLQRTGRIAPRPTLLAPHGEFAGGALALKPVRKALYRRIARGMGLLRGVTLHATSPAERIDIATAWPEIPIETVPFVRPLTPLPPMQPAAPDEPLRIAFVGRISPVKGLDVALRILDGVKARVRYTIFGPISDREHWQGCEALIAGLPSNVEVILHGEIANAAVSDRLAAQDLLLLPSRSENFGHAIFESLAAGTPVLIGDRTPWRDLEARRAGFDLPLQTPESFRQAIERFAAMPWAERLLWRQGARQLAEDYVANSPARLDMLRLLTDMCR